MNNSTFQTRRDIALTGLADIYTGIGMANVVCAGRSKVVLRKMQLLASELEEELLDHGRENIATDLTESTQS